MKMLDTPQAIEAIQAFGVSVSHIQTTLKISPDELADRSRVWRGVMPLIKKGSLLDQRCQYVLLLKTISAMAEIERHVKDDLWFYLDTFWPRKAERSQKRRKDRRAYSRGSTVRRPHSEQRAMARAM